MDFVFFLLFLLYPDSIQSQQEQWIQTKEIDAWYDKFNQCILSYGFGKSMEKIRKLCNIAAVGITENATYTVGEKVHPYCIVSDATCHTEYHYHHQIFRKVNNVSSTLNNNNNPYENSSVENN
jgi:hypothetical protein